MSWDRGCWIIEHSLYIVCCLNQVLVTAPSNIAVDNLTESLRKLDIVRIGHPSHSLAHLKRVCFDVLVEEKEEKSNLKPLRDDIQIVLVSFI